MTPKFRGVAEALRKLQHNLDHDSGKLMERIENADARRADVFAKSHKTVEGAHQNLDGIDDFLTDLEKSNQGPSLGASSPNSSSETVNGPRSTEVARKAG